MSFINWPIRMQFLEQSYFIQLWRLKAYLCFKINEFNFYNFNSLESV